MNSFESEVSINLASGYKNFFEKILIEKGWNYLDYFTRQKIISAHPRDLLVKYQDHELFRFSVPKTVFNPYKGEVAQKIIDLIFKNEIIVEGKDVIDLGRGSGVIGLAAILKNAKKILFTDINEEVVSLQDHPLLRSVDRVLVQDLLENTSKEEKKWDLIILSAPSTVCEKQSPLQKEEVGTFRDEQFIQRLIKQSAICLRPQGELVLMVSSTTDQGDPKSQILDEFARHDFALETYRPFVEYHTKHTKRVHLIFSIRKK